MAFEYLDQNYFGKKDLTMYGFGPVPLGPNGRRGSEFNSYMTGIYAGIEDKKLRDAAWEYIRFFDSLEANIIRANVYAEKRLARYIQPKYLRAAGLERQADLVPKEWNEAYDEAIQSGVPEPYGQNCQMVYDYTSKAIDQIRTDPQVKHLIEAHDEHGTKQRIRRNLTERVRFSNEKMLNLIPPEEKKKRTIMASIVAVIIFLLFTLLLRRVFKTFAEAQLASHGPAAGPMAVHSIQKWAYLILIPAIGSILLWSYYPAGEGHGDRLPGLQRAWIQHMGGPG
jgi:multiple sugar transport system permease protein